MFLLKIFEDIVPIYIVINSGNIWVNSCLKFLYSGFILFQQISLKEFHNYLDCYCLEYSLKQTASLYLNMPLRSMPFIPKHGCFPVNLLHIFRIPFLKNTSEVLLPFVVLFLCVCFLERLAFVSFTIILE